MGYRTVSVSSFARALAPAITVLLLCTGCPNPMRDTLENVVKDYSTPKTTVSSPNGMGIAKTTAIVITFSETMDTASLSLGGNMPTESDGGVWTSGANVSDTFTISPLSTWTVGSGKVLVVNCRDLQGYDTPSIVLNYGVLDGVVYVHAVNGDDANPGTPDKPKKTLPAAIDLAGLYYTTAEVHVAGGVYNVSYQAGTHVIIKQGISLYGGYDPSNWGTARNPSVYISKIKDTSTTPSTTKYRAVDCGVGLTSSTALDGFTVVGGGGTGTIIVGVYCDASNPTIRNNVLDGGSGDTSVALRISNASPLVENNTITGGNGVSTSGIFTYNGSPIIRGNIISWGQGTNDVYGIINTESTPTIENNTIGGSPGIPNYSTGIYNDNANAVIVRNAIDGGYAFIAVTGIDNSGGSIATIRNNTIHAGLGPAGQQVISKGISNYQSSAVIQNNTIDVGNPGGKSGASSLAIGISISSCTPTIDNNIIFCADSTTLYQDQYGVIESNASSTPVRFYNNDIYNCPDALYLQYPTTFHTNVTTLNALPWAESTISANPLFISMNWPNPDWHLTGSSPLSVREGGFNLSAFFTVDKDNVTRTAPWSIGAYEQN